MAINKHLLRSTEPKEAAGTAIVINGHGTKTNYTFESLEHTLITPGNLTKPYVFSVDPNYNIETDILNNKIKPVNGGNWTVYNKDTTSHVPEVIINP